MKAQDPAGGAAARRTTQAAVKLDAVKLEGNPAVRYLFSQDLSVYDILPSDEILVVYVPTGNVTVYLPPADENVGKTCTIKKGNPDVASVIVGTILGTDAIDATGTKTMNGADRACLVVFAEGQGRGWKIVSTFGTVT